MKYTYDDFAKAAKAAGMDGGFSQSDLKLARDNPDAGMSLLQYKKDYRNATTAEARALANQGAETIRSGYGGYTGGADGMGFYLEPISPSSFTPEEKPAFSYDVESDPVFSAYKKQYTREGRRAIQDTLGSASAATGGLPSSYAVTAASQAGDYYASQLSDKVPELEQQAYNRYLNDLSQWNTDRQFNYGQHIDEINSQTADRQEALQNALYGAQYGDYSGLAKLGYNVKNVPEEWQKQQQIADMMYKLGIAQANLGNYGYLNQLTGKYF